MYYSTLYKNKHNAVVDRIKNTAAGIWTIISEDKAFDATNIHPGFVLK